MKVLGLSLTLALLLAGCSDSGLVGKYDRQESWNRGEYLEFKKNGTFLAYNPSQGGFSGKYEVDGSTIKLSLQGPIAFTKIGTYDKSKGVINGGRRF